MNEWMKNRIRNDKRTIRSTADADIGMGEYAVRSHYLQHLFGCLSCDTACSPHNEFILLSGIISFESQSWTQATFEWNRKNVHVKCEMWTAGMRRGDPRPRIPFIFIGKLYRLPRCDWSVNRCIYPDWACEETKIENHIYFCHMRHAGAAATTAVAAALHILCSIFLTIISTHILCPIGRNNIFHGIYMPFRSSMLDTHAHFARTGNVILSSKEANK